MAQRFVYLAWRTDRGPRLISMYAKKRGRGVGGKRRQVCSIAPDLFSGPNGIDVKDQGEALMKELASLFIAGSVSMLDLYDKRRRSIQTFRPPTRATIFI